MIQISGRTRLRRVREGGVLTIELIFLLTPIGLSETIWVYVWPNRGPRFEELCHRSRP
jgi:hypothetical protein